MRLTGLEFRMIMKTHISIRHGQEKGNQGAKNSKYS
jgi:hypothetical protein